jgi:hypothetical protein
VEVTFATRGLRTVCEDLPAGSLPPAIADALRERIADLRAALSAKDLLGGVTMTPGPPPEIVLDLADGAVLRCDVAHRLLPRDGSGELRWALVRRVKVVEIGPPS